MNEDRSSHKFILLGASRGLGWATYQVLQKRFPSADFFLVSRKIGEGHFKSLKCDFSKELSSEFINEIIEFKPTAILYFAAGGPYGLFQDKKWSDHEWALKVSFLFPAQLLHHLMRVSIPSLKCFVAVGSSIAENKPDPGAASYCAAKHALKGLISTIQAENKSVFKVALFSPGYIETDMLPPQSWPRQQGLAETAENVANHLISETLSIL